MPLQSEAPHACDHRSVSVLMLSSFSAAGLRRSRTVARRTAHAQHAAVASVLNIPTELFIVFCLALVLTVSALTHVPAVAAEAAPRLSVPKPLAPSDWGSVEPPGTGSYKSRPQSTIRGITVHHQGEHWVAGNDVAAYLRRLQQWSRQARAWIDVPYHFIIAPDGAVYTGRSLSWAGDSNTDYDTLGEVQLMLLGNFEEQQPTAEQLRSTVGMLALLMAEHGLTADSIRAHRHHTGQTVCPGANLMARFEALREEASNSGVAR